LYAEWQGKAGRVKAGIELPPLFMTAWNSLSEGAFYAPNILREFDESAIYLFVIYG
jgi:hypothetical protein